MEVAAHSTDPHRLRHRPAVLPPTLAAGLVVHRAAVLALLVGGYTPAHDAAAYIVGERLGIADELGMPTHPGSSAWLVAVGESLCQCIDSGRLHASVYTPGIIPNEEDSHVDDPS